MLLGVNRALAKGKNNEPCGFHSLFYIDF